MTVKSENRIINRKKKRLEIYFDLLITEIDFELNVFFSYFHHWSSFLHRWRWSRIKTLVDLNILRQVSTRNQYDSMMSDVKHWQKIRFQTNWRLTKVWIEEKKKQRTNRRLCHWFLKKVTHKFDIETMKNDYSTNRKLKSSLNFRQTFVHWTPVLISIFHRWRRKCFCLSSRVVSFTWNSF